MEMSDQTFTSQWEVWGNRCTWYIILFAEHKTLTSKLGLNGDGDTQTCRVEKYTNTMLSFREGTL